MMMKGISGSHRIGKTTEKEIFEEENQGSFMWVVLGRQAMIIRMRKSGEIIKEEYAAFYKSLTND